MRQGRGCLWVAAAALTLISAVSGQEEEVAEEGVCDADSTSPECLAALQADDEEAQLSPPPVARPAFSSLAPIATGSQATADLLTQEVDELHSFIKVCQERIELLKELRAAVTSDVNLSLPESHVRALREPLPLLSEVTVDIEKAPAASSDDYLVSKAVIPQEDTVSFIKFLPLRNPRTSSPASSSQTAMPSALLVAGQVDGTVRLFTPSGELVLTFSAGHELPVAHLAVSPSHDEYVIATGDAGGVVRVHKVSVRQRRLTKEQKAARRNSTSERVSQHLGSQVNVTVQFNKQMQVPSGSDGEAPKLTALALASQQGTKYFVAGDVEGKISIFTKNGTLRSQIDTTATPGEGIEGLYAHLSNLLFRAGTEWGFIDLEKLEVKHVECPKFEGRVTAAIVDSQQSSRVIVADEAGTVWVFSVRNKRECKVEHRFAKGATVAPIDLASVRGFALGLEGAFSEGGGENVNLLALNMSHVGRRRHDLAAAPSPIVWRQNRPPIRGWAVHKRYQQGDLIALLSEDGHEIEIMELLMQVYQAPAADSFGNFKLPVIAVAIVLVLGYQYVKQKGKFGGGGGGSGGGKLDWDKADFSSLKKRKGLGGLKGSSLPRKKLGGL